MEPSTSRLTQANGQAPAATPAPAQTNGQPPAPAVPSPLPALLNSEEACAYLRIHRNTLDKLCKKGQIRRTQVGWKVRYKISELQRFLDRKTK